MSELNYNTEANEDKHHPVAPEFNNWLIGALMILILMIVLSNRK